MTNIYMKKPRDLTKAIGQRMATIRKVKGFTQDSLSEATKSSINFNTISVLERGLGDPKISTLYEIANALGISLSELLDISHPEMKIEIKRQELIDKAIHLLANLNETDLKIAIRQIEAFKEESR